MPRTGRVTKLTPVIQQAIVNAVTAGAPLVQAAELAGIDKSTVLEWMRRGEERDPVRPTTNAYANFANAITHAKASDEVRRIARIDAAARGGAVIHEKTTTYPDGRTVTERQVQPPDWRADSFHLERRYQDRWGKRVQADLTLQVRQIVQEVADEIGVSPDDIIKEATQFLKDHDARHRR
jgi:hypothetical protein